MGVYIVKYNGWAIWFYGVVEVKEKILQNVWKKYSCTHALFGIKAFSLEKDFFVVDFFLTFYEWEDSCCQQT